MSFDKLIINIARISLEFHMELSIIVFVIGSYFFSDNINNFLSVLQNKFEDILEDFDL